ncbi:MAG: hypothetical protein K6G26_06070, partial [Lachnospiraceae bacterium]|nr:hypothetical protein [Lachnospiraceae bacterium]
MKDKNHKEIYIIDEEIYIEEEQELVLTDKKLFIGETIKCEGTLIIENCDIVYASGLAYNSAIIARTGATVNIKNCNITEKGPHKCKFIKAGFGDFLDFGAFYKTPYIPEKLSKESIKYYHEESKIIKTAYGKLENQDENSDIKNMDSIVIENCTFTNKRGIFSKLFEKANKKEEYILLDCGGIVKDCTFDIDTKCKYGLIRGSHNPRVYLHKIKNKAFKFPIIDSSKGEDFDYHNLMTDTEYVALNILRARNYRQTKVINCEFNKSNFGILGNCIVKDSKFNSCKKAIQDVYDIKDCTFNNCNEAIVRNIDINPDNAANNNTFSNNISDISKKKDKRTTEKNMLLLIGVIAALVFFIFLIYSIITDLKNYLSAEKMSGIHLERYLLVGTIVWLYGFFNLVNLKSKTVLNYIRTGRTLKKLKKIIAISILGTLYSGIFLLCFFVGCYELYSISKDGVKVI